MVASPGIFQETIIPIQAVDEGHVLDGEVKIDGIKILNNSISVGRLRHNSQSLHRLCCNNEEKWYTFSRLC